MSCIAHDTRAWHLRWLLAIVFLALAANVAWGQTPGVTRVEEDWEMVVASPCVERGSPQVTCAMSPSGDAESYHGVFELNHRTLPAFSAGGMQLQVWSGEAPLSERASQGNLAMNTPDEKVTWTQVMEVNGATLVFEIINGSSTTWGSFGGQGYYKIVTIARAGDLNAYSPEYSVHHSSVGYGGNRVDSLVLKRVRYFLSNGQQAIDSTERVVHPQP